MIGELAVSFCERNVEEPCLCIDLWSYPDGTCNLVLSASIGSVDYELCFPCDPHHLEAVLNGKPHYTENGEGSILVEKCGDQICAEYESLKSGLHLRQCILTDEYRQAVNTLMVGTLGYLA